MSADILTVVNRNSHFAVLAPADFDAESVDAEAIEAGIGCTYDSFDIRFGRYASPTDDGDDYIHWTEARDAARIDPSLVYATIKARRDGVRYSVRFAC